MDQIIYLKMKKTVLYLSIALALVFAQACNKGNNDPGPQGSTTNPTLLKTWKASAVLEGNLDITSEFSNYRITFSESGSNKTFILVDRQGVSTTGTWSISTDETKITLDVTGGATISLAGVSIGTNQLKYTADEVGKTGQVTLSFTLVPA